MDLNQFERLAEELSKEARLMKSRIIPATLKNLHDNGLAEVKISHGHIIAFVALWPTSHNSWYELGTLWIHSDWRGKNLATKIFKKCLRENKERNIFLITRSIKVVHLAQTHGMEETEKWHTDQFWKKLCVPWDKLPQQGSRILPKEGRLFSKRIF